MKTRYYIRVKIAVRGVAGIAIVSFISAVLLCSCVRDDTEFLPPSPAGAEVTLTLQVPGIAKNETNSEINPGTRAMPADESTIHEVYVLLFNPSGGTYIDRYKGSTPQTVPGDASKRIFTVTLPPGTYDLMVMANSETFITSATLSPGMSRADASAALRLSQSTGMDHTAIDRFPFWGEKQNAVVTTGSPGATISDIPLNRAVAKIDIVSSDAVKAEFTLESVTLCHWQNSMALIPDAGNITGNEITTATATGSGLRPYANRTVYPSTAIDNGESITSKIYLNETPNPGASAFPVMPCLIVGGQLAGQTGTRYYRIDIYTVENDTRVYRDILRNHRYTITLNEILTNGSGTEDEAYESTTVSIETNIVDWNESDLKDWVIDGSYRLRVEPAEFTLAREPNQPTPGSRAEPYSTQDYFFEIEANTNWTIDQNSIVYSPAAQNNWFSLNNWSGIADAITDMEIYVTENTTGASRSATFTVAAGTIRFEVTVTQTTDPMTWIRLLNIDGTEWSGGKDITSFADRPGEFEFILEWYPEDWDCEVTVTHDYNYDGIIQYEDNYEIKTETVTGGRKHYNIKMKNYTESEVNLPLLLDTYGSDDLVFKVGDVTKTSYFVHVLTALVYEPTVYRLDIPGSELEVHFDTSFKVKEVNDTHNILTAATKSALEMWEHGSTPWVTSDRDSRTLQFEESSPEKDGKKVYVTFSFPYTPGMPDKTIELEAYHLQPNSYIVKPGESVHIPVRKAWRAWSQHPMSSELPEGVMGCEIVWQTASGLISEVALTPAYSEKNIDSELFVRTNTAAGDGNALVALTVDGEIVWSWHIWVTYYDPEQDNYTYVNNTGDTRTTFMDRNFGAFSNNNSTDADKYNSQGLMYQGGRKDPFPATNNIADSLRRPFPTNHTPLFYPSGRSPYRTQPRQSWTDNLQSYRYSIANPTTFITVTDPPYHWNYETGPGNTPWYIFVNDKRYKAEFDPCPDGWELPMTSYAFGSTNETGANQFYDPRPSFTDIANYGYTRSDGFYFPNTGYINNLGMYQYVGHFRGAYMSFYSESTGYYRQHAFLVDYVVWSLENPPRIRIAQSGQNMANANTVRCSRIEE